jgi:hypothetical protein
VVVEVLVGLAKEKENEKTKMIGSGSCGEVSDSVDCCSTYDSEGNDT